MPRIITLIIALFLSATAIAADGLITKKSAHGVNDTMDRLENALKSKGITIVKRLDHHAGAKKVDMPLRPTALLIFGNPKLGTPLMQSNQTVGLDLPMKALVWQDADGQVWLTYNDPAYFASRHGITDRPEVIKKMTGALNKFTDIATKP